LCEHPALHEAESGDAAGARRIVRPFRLVSVAMGIVFVFLGLTEVMPAAGLFGWIWTVGSAAIAATNLYAWLRDR
jgi:hypothetical protein